MLSLLISLLIGIIVLGVVFWAARSLIAAFKIPDPIATVIIVVLVLISLVVVVSWLGLLPGGGLRLR